VEVVAEREGGGGGGGQWLEGLSFGERERDAHTRQKMDEYCRGRGNKGGNNFFAG